MGNCCKREVIDQEIEQAFTIDDILRVLDGKLTQVRAEKDKVNFAVITPDGLDSEGLDYLTRQKRLYFLEDLENTYNRIRNILLNNKPDIEKIRPYLYNIFSKSLLTYDQNHELEKAMNDFTDAVFGKF